MSAPGLRAPWATGLTLFLALSAGGGVYLARPRDAVPQSVLDARRDGTVAVARAVDRVLDGGLDGLSRVAAVVDESIRQNGTPLLLPFQHNGWRSLFLVDRAGGTVVDHVGETPAPLGGPPPAGTGTRLALAGSAPRVVQYAPAGTRYLLVGQLDPAGLGDVLGPGTWLVDRTGSVLAGPRDGPPPAVSGTEGSVARRRDVVAWASVGGGLGWTVVSSRATAAARDHRALAVALAALTVIVFGALHLLVLRPVGRLERAGHGEAGQISLVLHRIGRR